MCTTSIPNAQDMIQNYLIYEETEKHGPFLRENTIIKDQFGYIPGVGINR